MRSLKFSGVASLLLLLLLSFPNPVASQAKDKSGDKFYKLWNKSIIQAMNTEENILEALKEGEELVEKIGEDALSPRAQYIMACLYFRKLQFYFQQAVQSKGDTEKNLEQINQTIDPTFSWFISALKKEYNLTTSSGEHPYGLKYGFQPFMDMLHVFYDGMMDEYGTPEPYDKLLEELTWWKSVGPREYYSWWIDKETNIAAWEERTGKIEASAKRWTKVGNLIAEWQKSGIRGPFYDCAHYWQAVRVYFKAGMEEKARAAAVFCMKQEHCGSPGSALAYGADYIIHFQLWDGAKRWLLLEKNEKTDSKGAKDYLAALKEFVPEAVYREQYELYYN